MTDAERDRLIAERDKPSYFVQAAQNTVDFLNACEWNDNTSERNATDIAEALQDEIVKAERAESNLTALQAERDEALNKRVAQGLRLGQILGPDYDWASFEEVARRLVEAESQLTALRGALNSLAGRWAAAGSYGSDKSYNTALQSCARELSAALAVSPVLPQDPR
jgi:flagellar biosynthesis/type III secretory pathway protein FliH